MAVVGAEVKKSTESVKLYIFLLFFSNLLIECDHIPSLGVVARQTQSQVVRLRAGVDKEADRQIAGHFAGQHFGALHELVVQKTIIRRDSGHL